MATSTPQETPVSPEQRLAIEQQARYQRITRNLAIGGMLVCPAIALLPPRKLDLYTLSLGIGFYLSADHLCTLRTGRGLVSHLGPMKAVSLPTERAQNFQKQFAEEKERKDKLLGNIHDDVNRKSALEKLWMGDEEEGWRRKRIEEERKALEEGKTYTDLIFDQVWEVWNWDKRKKGSQGEEKKKE